MHLHAKEKQIVHEELNLVGKSWYTKMAKQAIDKNEGQ